jgi:hypothetical protein
VNRSITWKSDSRSGRETSEGAVVNEACEAELVLPTLVRNADVREGFEEWDRCGWCDVEGLGNHVEMVESGASTKGSIGTCFPFRDFCRTGREREGTDGMESVVVSVGEGTLMIEFERSIREVLLRERLGPVSEDCLARDFRRWPITRVGNLWTGCCGCRSWVWRYGGREGTGGGGEKLDTTWCMWVDAEG